MGDEICFIGGIMKMKKIIVLEAFLLFVGVLLGAFVGYMWVGGKHDMIVSILYILLGMLTILALVFFYRGYEQNRGAKGKNNFVDNKIKNFEDILDNHRFEVQNSMYIESLIKPTMERFFPKMEPKLLLEFNGFCDFLLEMLGTENRARTENLRELKVLYDRELNSLIEINDQSEVITKENFGTQIIEFSRSINQLDGVFGKAFNIIHTNDFKNISGRYKDFLYELYSMHYFIVSMCNQFIKMVNRESKMNLNLIKSNFDSDRK